MLHFNMGKIWHRVLSACLVLTVLCGMVIPSFAIGGVDDDGLVAFWDFENTSGKSIPDASGNGHNGTAKNDVTTVSLHNGKAMKFDGTQAVDVPFSEDLKFKKNETFTFSLWFNIDSNIGTSWHMLAGMGRPSGAAWYALYICNNDLYWTSQSNGGYTADPGAYDYVIIGQPTREAWHCVTVVHDGTKGESRCYLDGNLAATCAARSNLESREAGFVMGYSGTTAEGNDLGQYFKGEMDNIRVYSKGLSAQEISDLYTAEIDDYVMTEGLEAFWDFEDVSGRNVPDASGNGHNGTAKKDVTTVAQKKGKAMTFDGTQAVDVPFSESLKFEKSETFTFSLWFNIDSTIGTGWRMLASMGRPSGAAWYAFYMHNGDLYWTSQTNGGYTADKGGYDYIVIAKPESETWNCVTVVHDGAAGVSRCYYNGQLVSFCSAQSNLQSGEAGFVMGYSGITAEGKDLGEYFKGELDNVRVYSGGLSSQKISDLYNADKTSYANLGALPVGKEYVKWTQAWPHPDGEEKVNVIYDTDMAPDCDDAGALAMLHGCADQGLVDILACVCDTSNQYGAPCIDAINTYYGRPDIPVGTLKSKATICPTDCSYNRYISQVWENDIYNGYMARDAVDVYREALAKAEDNSVTIIVVGMQTNLMDLLKSEPDEYSELTGLELVRKKVKLVSAMAGGYPSKASECNIVNDPEAAEYVTKNWPTPIMYSGFEVGYPVAHGAVRTQMAEDNPVRKAYDLHKKNTDKFHSSWDLTSVLYAVEGLGQYWTMDRGDVEIIGGGDTFVPNEETGARAFLIKSMSNTDIGKRLDEMFLAAEKNNPDEPRVTLVDVAPDVEGMTFDGTWANDPNKEKLAYNGTVYYTDKTTDSISYEFVGSGIDVFGGYNVDHCIVDVYIDGKLVESVDTYSKDDVASSLIYSNSSLAYGEHTLTLKKQRQKQRLKHRNVYEF